MDTVIHEVFEHNWGAHLLDSLPSVEPVLYFPGGKQIGGRDGLLVKLLPRETGPWTAMFAFGDAGPSGVYSCPNPDHICIVSRGTAYLLDVERPSEHVNQFFEVTNIYQVGQGRLVILVGSNDISAIGRSGCKWTAGDLGPDVEITSIDDCHIHGLAEHAGESVPFSITLEDGKVS